MRFFLVVALLASLGACGAGHVPGTGGDHFTQTCPSLDNRARLDCLEGKELAERRYVR